MKSYLRILIALLMLLSAQTIAVESKANSLTLNFNLRIEIDPMGNILRSEVLGASHLKPEFIEIIKAKLSEIDIGPQLHNGAPVNFITGLRLELLLTTNQSGIIVEIKDHFLYPITLHMVHLPKPRVLSSNGSDSPIVVNCTVGIEGICTSLDVDVPLGVPRQDAVKYAKEMYGQWKFEPQSADGVPIIGQRVFTIYLNGPGIQHFEHKVRHPQFTSPRGPVVGPSTRRP